MMKRRKEVDLTRSDAEEQALFRKYGIALRLWARRFNTAEIAAHLNEPEHIVCRWIWHWRELSRGA
jgi:hypothetical protein